jgi:hypothetical protein
MDEISFICPNIEIQAKIKHLRSFVKPKTLEGRKRATLEIRIQPQYVTFHIPGAQEKLYCATKGWGSFTLSLEYFYQVLTDYTGDIFNPKFIDGEMHAGGLFTKGLGFKIQNTHPENDVTLDLPINYTHVDILKLRGKIKSKEIEIVNSEQLISKAEAKLESDINAAYKILTIYGVSLEEIEALVGKHTGFFY